jgi:hypothetical protein
MIGKFGLEVLTDLHGCGISQYEKVVSGMPYVWPCECSSIALQRLDRLYSVIFFHHKHSSLKNLGRSYEPPKENYGFLKQNDFDLISLATGGRFCD